MAVWRISPRPNAPAGLAKPLTHIEVTPEYPTLKSALWRLRQELQQLLEEQKAAGAAATEASEQVERVRAESKALNDARLKHERRCAVPSLPALLPPYTSESVLKISR